MLTSAASGELVEVTSTAGWGRSSNQNNNKERDTKANNRRYPLQSLTHLLWVLMKEGKSPLQRVARLTCSPQIASPAAMAGDRALSYTDCCSNPVGHFFCSHVIGSQSHRMV